MSTKTKIEISETVSRKAFISFIVAMVTFMVTNVDVLINGDWELHLPWVNFPQPLFYYLLKVIGYSIVTALAILFGIKHPGINRFMTELVDVLRDGKMDEREKLHMIEVFKDEFLGRWAELSYNVYKEQEDPPADIDPSEVTG